MCGKLKVYRARILIRVTVEAPQEVAVEFVDVWGDVTVDLGERLIPIYGT